MAFVKRALLSLFLVIGLVTGSVNAQEETGLILGFRYGGDYDASHQKDASQQEKTEEVTKELASYHTLWLHTQEKQLKVVTEKTNLLVPREDGFWRVDVRHSTYNNFKEDFIWINPPPDPDMPVNPFLANKEGVDAFDVAILVKEQGIETRRGEHCTGYTYRDILFIEEQHISVGYTNNEACQGAGEATGESALQILGIEDLGPLQGLEVLGKENWASFEKLAQNFKEKKQDQGSQDWGKASVGVMRGAGRWIIKGHFPSQNNYVNFDVDLPLPEGLVKHNALVPDWETIKKQFPEAVDAFSSPSKEWLVILTKSSLLSFKVEQGKVNSQPTMYLTFEYPLTVVMAQWAEGQFVENWSQEIDSLGPKPTKPWFVETKLTVNKSEENGPLPLFGVVTTPQGIVLNIREGMGEHTKLIGRVEKNSKLRILDILGQWYKVQLHDGQVGYAHGDYIKVLPKLPYRKPACPFEACSYGKWQLKNPATLYAMPSTEANTITQLKAQQILQALEGQMATDQYGEILVIKESQINALPLDAPSVENKETLKLGQGDMLFDIEDQGKGIHVMWYQGKLYYLEEAWQAETSPQLELWGKVLTARKTDWWVRVELAEQNLKGWIVNPQAENIGDPKA